MEYRQCLKDLKAYVPGRQLDDVKKEYGLEKVYKLASNESTYGPSPKAKEAIRNMLDDTFLYPDGYCTKLRSELVKEYNIDENQVIFGNGTDELIFMIAKAFIDKGDECITAEITFSEYTAAVLSMDGTMIYAPMDNLAYDLDAIYREITPQTKIIALVNPNNPTGTMFSNEEQMDFLLKVPKNILVLIDEAYGEFANGEKLPDTLNMVKEFDNVLWLKTFSKAYGLASLRMGFAVGNSKIIEALEKVRMPFNVSLPAQVAAVEAFKDREFLNDVVKKTLMVKAYFYKELDALSIRYIQTDANFVLCKFGENAPDLLVELMKKGYIVRGGSPFGLDEYLRITFGTMEEMTGFVSVLKELLK